MRSEMAFHVFNAPSNMPPSIFKNQPPWEEWTSELGNKQGLGNLEVWHQRAVEIRRRAKGIAMTKATKDYTDWTETQKVTYDKVLYKITKAPPSRESHCG